MYLNDFSANACPNTEVLDIQVRTAFDSGQTQEVVRLDLDLVDQLRNHLRGTDPPQGCAAPVAHALIEAITQFQLLTEQQDELRCRLTITTDAFLASKLADASGVRPIIKEHRDQLSNRGCQLAGPDDAFDAPQPQEVIPPPPEKPKPQPDLQPDPRPIVPPVKPHRPLQIAGGAVLGASLVGWGVFGGMLAGIQDAEGDLQDACYPTCSTVDSRVIEARTRGTNLQYGAAISGAVAAATLVTSVALLAVAHKRKRAHTAMVPALSPRFAGITWVLRF